MSICTCKSLRTNCCRWYFTGSRNFILFACCLFLSVVISGKSVNADADVFEFFEGVASADESSGEFAWDEFGLTGSPYAGPHAPDQFDSGIGNVSLSVNAGGLITSTSNLYSFTSVATWDFSLAELDESNFFSSVVVQFATSTAYGADQFTLNGVVPDEFIDLGQRTEIGGFPYNFYWVEWHGMDASSSYTVELVGTGMHQSLAGAKATYFNTAVPFDITFDTGLLFGDVNGDGSVDLLDVSPFVELIATGGFNDNADINRDGAVDLLDVLFFVEILTGTSG